MDRNLILAIALSMGVLLVWDILVAGPQREAIEAAREAQRVEQQVELAESGDITSLDEFAEASKTDVVTLDDAMAMAPGRVAIQTPNLTGSINLLGGRIDDLSLTQFRETIDDQSPIIRLLNPENTEHGHYTQQGWSVGGQRNDNAIWTVSDGATLTPSTPVTLTRQEGDLVFEKTFSVDENFMFTVSQRVINRSSESVNLTPYAFVFQRGFPEDMKNFMILHEGPLGVIGTELHERKYKKLAKDKSKAIQGEGIGGWIGITNKNWLAAVIPPQNVKIKALLTNDGTNENPVFKTFYAMEGKSLAAGESIDLTSHVFAGAKIVKVLKGYKKPVDEGGLGIHGFDRAVDWGHLFFLTRPIFMTLNFFGNVTGNFGVAILILTLIIKLILFPVANKGFESMAKMKKLQPEIEKLRKRYDDDKTKLQQEMMALYKKENMNPLAGCFPILLQMPIFFALYKTLFVTMELRHQPFLYIQDLSAADPMMIFNLFGLLPYDPTALPIIGGILGIGLLPVLMGVAMWFQTKLNPPPADPMQAQMFAMMPFVFVFIFAPFAAGLVLYWFWNTALSILQQWLIMKKNGVTIDWSERFKLPGSKKSAASESK